MEMIELIKEKIKESQSFDLLHQLDLKIKDINTSDKDVILLEVISEMLEDNEGEKGSVLIDKLPNFSEYQLGLLNDTISSCCTTNFQTKDELTNFLFNFFNTQELLHFNIDDLTDENIYDLNKIFSDYQESIGSEITTETLAFNPDLVAQIRFDVVKYLQDIKKFDNNFIDNVESAKYTRDVFDDEDIILEGVSGDDKMKKIEEMDDQSIIFLYALFSGDYTKSYSYSMRSELADEVMKHPDGKISQYLSPITPQQQQELFNNNNTEKVDVDQFWKSMKDKYGTQINENLLSLYVKLFPINECKRLLISLSNINVIKGINENYYMVSGKSLNNIKLLK